MVNQTKLTFKRGKLIRVHKKLRRNQRFAREQIERQCMALRDKNKVLVRENVYLLSEMETIKKQNIDICKQLVDHNNDHIVVRNLLSLKTSLDSNHKQMQQLLTQSTLLYNSMIEQINNQISELINSCNENNVNANCEQMRQSMGKTTHKMSAQQMSDSRKQSVERIDRTYYNNHPKLSVINEQSTELIGKMDGSSNTEAFNQTNTGSQYQMTPVFESKKFGTPSIFNLDSISFSTNCDNSTICDSDMSAEVLTIRSQSPELLFETLNTTNEEFYAISESTPVVAPNRKSILKDRFLKRVSSINSVYSPLTINARRSSIQNLNTNRNIISAKADLILRRKTFEVKDLADGNENSENVNNKKAKRVAKTDTIPENTSAANTSKYKLRERQTRVSYNETKYRRNFRDNDYWYYY